MTRLVGLLGRSSLSAGEGLWIVPSSGVHTIGMRFPIDVVLLDADLRVVAVHSAVAAGRVVGLRSGVDSALELPARTLHADSLRPGDLLVILPE